MYKNKLFGLRRISLNLSQGFHPNSKENIFYINRIFLFNDNESKKYIITNTTRININLKSKINQGTHKAKVPVLCTTAL